MKLERLHITVFLALAAIPWGAVLLIQGVPVSSSHLAPFGTVVGFLALIGLAFEKLLWRRPWLHGWFVKRPDLRGTWRVELQSSYILPVDCPERDCTEKLPKGDRVPMIVCYMGVEQTLSTLRMHLMTPQSDSWSISANIRPSSNGNGFQVIVVYTNEPDVHQRDARTSEMHQGAFLAETHGPGLRPTTLKAKYWTDRKTIGTMNFTARINEVHTRIEDAECAFLEKS